MLVLTKSVKFLRAISRVLSHRQGIDAPVGHIFGRGEGDPLSHCFLYRKTFAVFRFFSFIIANVKAMTVSIGWRVIVLAVSST